MSSPSKFPERIRAPPTGVFQIAAERRGDSWPRKATQGKQGPVLSRAISQLLSLSSELQSYGSVGSSTNPEGTENELLGSGELGE